jgi:hypothetical protein
MTVKHLALIVALAVLVLGASATVAASCDSLSPADQEAQADAIVDGTVVDTAVVGFKTEVTVNVDRVLKGNPGPTIVLQASLPGQGVAGEVPFSDGWKYWRLYLRETEPGSGQYYTMTCFGSHEIPAPPGASGG